MSSLHHVLNIDSDPLGVTTIKVEVLHNSGVIASLERAFDSDIKAMEIAAEMLYRWADTLAVASCYGGK